MKERSFALNSSSASVPLAAPSQAEELEAAPAPPQRVRPCGDRETPAGFVRFSIPNPASKSSRDSLRSSTGVAQRRVEERRASGLPSRREFSPKYSPAVESEGEGEGEGEGKGEGDVRVRREGEGEV